MAITGPDTLADQFAQINAQVPPPVASRVDAASGQIKTSGVAAGLPVGAAAPDFTLPNATGQSVSLRDRLAAGPVVLVFYRGEWCPYCNLQLRALQAVLPEITARGASLIAISPQTPDHSLSVTEKNELTFDVLSDVDQAVIRAYRTQFTVPDDLQDVHLTVFENDLRSHTGNGTWELPAPATFVIDQAGIIRAAEVSPDYRVRIEPAAVISELAKLES